MCIYYDVDIVDKYYSMHCTGNGLGLQISQGVLTNDIIKITKVINVKGVVQ